MRFPDNAFVLFMEARALVGLGRLSQLERVLGEMVRLGTDQRSLLRIAEELRAHGHQREARHIEQQILAWYETDPEHRAPAPPDSVTWASALVLADRLPEAHGIVRELVDRYPDHIGFRGFLGVIAALAGDVEEASRIDRELAQREGKYLLGNHYAWRARIAASLGEREQAVDLLRSAFTQGVRIHPSDWRTGFEDGWGEWELVWPHSEPEFESLRGYPPFEELMRPKG